MIYVNPSFDQLKELAHYKQLRLVVRGEDCALGDADVHLHRRLMEQLTGGISGVYKDEEAFYVERYNGAVKVIPAYKDAVPSFPPKVEAILSDLTRLMDEHREQERRIPLFMQSFGAFRPAYAGTGD